MKISHRIIIPLLSLLAATPTLVRADGAQVYADNCAVCHKADGSGLPGTFPALMGQPILSGDPDTIIKIILLGPAKVLPPDSPKYTGQMPPITGLSDFKIAAVVTYIRDKFGKGASAVDDDEVAKVKASLAQ